MDRHSANLRPFARPLLVGLALGLVAWALARETRGPLLAHPSAGQVALVPGVMREAR